MPANDQQRNLSETEYREIYEGWISKALKTEREVMSEYSDREQGLLYKFIEFTYQILAVIGIFAGFGFTALGQVKSLWLFFLGESILISTILFGLYWLKKFYESNLGTIQKSSKEVFKIYKQRDEFFLQIARDFAEKQILKKANLINAQKKDEEVLNWIRNHTGENTDKKETLPHTKIILSSIVGLIFVFLSFLIKFCFI